MRSLTILTLTLLVYSTSCESGYEPEGLFEDTEAENPEFECFMTLSSSNYNHKLTCFFKDPDAEHSNISFSVCSSFTNSCATLKPEKNKYALRSNHLSLAIEYEICVLQLEKKMQCKKYELKDIVKPHAPTNVTITYQKEGKEYIIGYKVKRDIQTEKYFYQIAIREEHGKWKYHEVKILEFRLLEQHLTQHVKYEVKVRSKPNGEFFKGSWSNWSEPVYFETRIEDPARDDGWQLMIIILSSVGALLLIVVVFMVMWEKRIKPYVWPHIPDHKSTLESCVRSKERHAEKSTGRRISMRHIRSTQFLQLNKELYKKQERNLDISFNPDYFVDVHIHKVDGIQAKTQEDGLLESSEILDEDLAGESWSGSPLKTTLGFISENALVPPAMLTKNQPVVLQDAPPVDSSQLNGYALDSSAPHQVSINAAQGYENSTSQTHTVNGTSTSPDHFRVSHSNPDQQIPVLLHNVIKAACQEEAYVSMSAFPAASIPR